MTLPPVKATSRACAIDVRAAALVRVLARVATRMPKKPASPEQVAPTTNETATSEVPRVQLKAASRIATATTK
jgi:hypothetical protein